MNTNNIINNPKKHRYIVYSLIAMLSIGLIALLNSCERQPSYAKNQNEYQNISDNHSTTNAVAVPVVSIRTA